MMKMKSIQFLSLMVAAVFAVANYAVAACKPKVAKNQIKSNRPEITAEEANVMVSRFDLAGWNDGGEDLQPGSPETVAHV